MEDIDGLAVGRTWDLRGVSGGTNDIREMLQVLRGPRMQTVVQTVVIVSVGCCCFACLICSHFCE